MANTPPARGTIASRTFPRVVVNAAIALVLLAAGMATFGVATMASSAAPVTLDTTTISVSGDFPETRLVRVTTTSPRARWSASTTATWLTVSPATGMGAGTVVVTAEPNTSGVSRTATLTIASRPVTVTQSGAASSPQITIPADTMIGDLPPWVTVTNGSGSGSGTVTLTAAPNPSVLPRSATMTIAGQAVTVTQDGGIPSFAVAPNTVSGAAPGGLHVVGLTSSIADATWTASTDRAWLTASPSHGMGSATVTLTLAPNASVFGRSATATIAGRLVNVTQAGAVPTFAVTPGAWGAAAAGGTQQVSLAGSPNDAAWTAGSDRAWLSVSPGSGTGSAVVTLTAAPSSSAQPRSATATIAGRVVIVTQAGAVPTFAITQGTWSVAPGGGTASLALSSSLGDAPWTTSSDRAWLSIGPAAGTGPTTVTLTAAPTTGAQPRTATAIIAGQVVTVTQAGAVPVFALAQGTWTAAAGGGAQTLALGSSLNDAPWTATSDRAWLAISPAAGTGAATVTLTAAPTTSTLARTATATIAGQAVLVTQAGAPATFAVTPAAWTAPIDGGSHGLSVVTPIADASWSATSAAPWLSVSPTSGVGTAAVTVVAKANTAQAGRTGTLVIAGHTVTVAQPGRQPAATISDPNWTAPPTGGSREVTLDIPDAGAWHASTDASWISISPARGAGNGAVTIAAMPAGTASASAVGLARDFASLFDVPAGAPTMTVSQSYAGGVRTGTVVFAPVAPSATYTRYLAEGATSSMFDTRLALLNPTATADEATISFLRDGQAPLDYKVALPPQQRVTVWPKAIPGLESAEFSTIVKAAVPVVVDRTMTWDATGYGAHAETAATEPAATWYLAEGATHSGFSLFYLLQNPGDTPTTVRVRYLRASGAPLEKDYQLAARSRTNIWVNVEEFPGLGQALASAEFSAVVSSLDQTPIIVERAMYRSSPERTFDAGHASMGVSTPSTRWFMAEGRTGPFFDQFVLIANPTDAAADVRVTYLLDTGQTYTRTMTAPANARSGIWVDYEQIPGVAGYPLADVALSTTVESVNGVPLVVERTMWWPGDGTTWYEAHNSAGAVETGTKWALAEGEVGGGRNAQTYVLMANTSTSPGRARVTVLFEDGSSRAAIYPLLAQSRTSAAIGPDFGPAVQDKRFSVIVEALGVTDDAPAPQIVVERAMYSDAAGVPMAAGTNALATKLQ